MGRARRDVKRAGGGVSWYGSALRRTNRSYGVRRRTVRFESFLGVRPVESGDEGRYFEIALRLLAEMGDEAPAFVQARIDELFDQADPEMVEWAMIRNALALSMDGSRVKH